MPEKNEFEIKVRKSSLKKDVEVLSAKLDNKLDISPYNLEELTKVIISAIRAKELKLEKEGRSYFVKDVEKWFKERLMVNTIILSEGDYRKALYRAFRLLILADIAKTDFGGSRQRDFGQRWTDFTRGFLGEIGIEKFFKEKLGVEIDLEEAEIGDVEKFLPTDITKIKQKGSWRDVKTNISIKTSKLGSMWLDIGTQLHHSDAFIFIKIGLTVDHLVHFLKNMGFVDTLVNMAQKLGEVKDLKKELKLLVDNIEEIKPFPTYVSGFVWKKDMEEGELEIYETSKGNKKIVGGCGLFSGEPTKKIEGLGELSPPKHLACLGSLRWSKEDWKKLKDKI